jgi:cytochrome b561
MALRDYGYIAKFFYGLISCLVVIQILLGFFWVLTNGFQTTVINWHKCLGLTILVLNALALLWLFCSRIKLMSAGVVPVLLYACLFALPLTGWISTTAAGNPPVFWGHTFAMPGVPFHTSFAILILELHGVFAGIFIALAVIYVLTKIKVRKRRR